MNQYHSLHHSLRLGLLFISLLLILSCKQESKSSEKSLLSESHSTLDHILEKGILRVGTTGDFMPFSYQSDPESSEYFGIDIELAKDLAKSLGVKLKLVKTSWPKLMSDLHANQFDICMSGVTIKLDRQSKALFSEPVLESGKAVITRDENVQKYQRLEDINKKEVKIIVNLGGTNEAFARQHFPNAQIIENEDNLSIFQKIVDGYVDLMVTDAIETLVQEQIHPELEAANPNKPFNFFEMGYLLPRDFTFKAYVDQWLHLRKKEGVYDKIFEKEIEKISSQITSIKKGQVL